GRIDLATADNQSDQVSLLLNTGSGFRDAEGLPVGQDPIQIAAADLDGDGAQDLINTNLTDGTVTVIFEAGGLAPPPAVSFSAGIGAFAVAVGDIDGDGDLDLAVADRAPSQNVNLLLNQGGRQFTLRSPPLSAGPLPEGIALGDLDG